MFAVFHLTMEEQFKFEHRDEEEEKRDRSRLWAKSAENWGNEIKLEEGKKTTSRWCRMERDQEPESDSSVGRQFKRNACVKAWDAWDVSKKNKWENEITQSRQKKKQNKKNQSIPLDWSNISNHLHLNASQCSYTINRFHQLKMHFACIWMGFGMLIGYSSFNNARYIVQCNENCWYQ